MPNTKASQLPKSKRFHGVVGCSSAALAVLFLLFAPSQAAACGSITNLDGEAVAIEDCNNPFGVSTDVPAVVRVDGALVEPDGTMGIRGTTTALLNLGADDSTYTPTLYRHTPAGYEEVALSEQSMAPPTATEIKALAWQRYQEPLGPVLDEVVAVIEGVMPPSDLSPEAQTVFAAIGQFSQPAYSRTRYAPIPVGTYTLVSTEVVLCVSHGAHSWWPEWLRPAIAHAAACGQDPAVRSVTFTLETADIPPFEPEPEPIDPLLLQYAPTLQFHEDEQYFPMNVEPFIEASALWDGSGSDTQLYTADELTVETLTDYIETNDTTDHYLAFSDGDTAGSFDLANAYATYQSLVDSGAATSTVYVHKMEDSYVDNEGEEHEFIVLQYWFFYAMNNWGEQGGFNDHEGDWESVFVFLDKATERPEYVAYSAHLNDGQAEWYNVKQYGSVRRQWGSEEVETDGDSVVSYVALGSHANYSIVGNGIKNIPLQKNEIVSKNGTKLVSYEMKVAEYNILNDYQGLWGVDTIQIGGDGPQGPAFIDLTGQTRFANPIEWAGIDGISRKNIREKTKDLFVGLLSFSFDNPVPEGAEITVEPHTEPVSGQAPEGVNVLPTFWDISTNLENGTFNTLFGLPYDTALLEELDITPATLTGLFFSPETGSWSMVSSTVDTAEEMVWIETDHFSRYGLGYTTAAPESDEETLAETSTTTDTDEVTNQPEQPNLEEIGQVTESTSQAAYPRDVWQQRQLQRVAGVSVSRDITEENLRDLEQAVARLKDMISSQSFTKDEKNDIQALLKELKIILSSA